MHGNDKRPLSARCRLCVSDKMPDNSNPWLSSMAARGKLSEVPLMRIREMKRLTPPNHVGDAVEAYNLSPAERCQQKGVKAASKIVESLVSGTPMASPDARVDIVEFNLLAVPDWVEAAWALKSLWQSDSGKPRISYFGLTREHSIQKAVVGHMEAILMGEWWDSHSEAGPKEPEHSGPIERPSLSLTSWEGDVPALSEVVICKFDGDEAYGEKWAGKVSSFREFVTSTVAPVVRRNAGDGEGSSVAAAVSDGPDMSVGDQPAVVTDAVLPATAAADFKAADVCLNLYYSLLTSFEACF